MTMKTVLAALLAAGLITSAVQAPAFAEEGDDATTMDEPMDPGTDDAGDEAGAEQ